MTRRTQAHEFWYIPKRVLKEPLAGCSKRSRCEARRNTRMKAEI
jgi:hypothetical protein